MAFRVYSGPRGSEDISPAHKDRYLYKELNSLDDALSWARKLHGDGHVALLVEGDDGTKLTKREIAAELGHPEAITRKSAAS